ncbi:MAG: DUF4157 domain-containing protein [Pseudomonadota bacterium]
MGAMMAARMPLGARARSARPLPIRAKPPARTQGPAPLQPKSGCACGGGCARCQGGIAGPDHPAEREAEAVARHVLSMPEPATAPGATLQRMPGEEHALQTMSEEEGPIQTMEEEEPLQMMEDEEEHLQMMEEEEEALQTKADPGILQRRESPGSASTGGVGRATGGLSGGRPLPAPLRAYFEPRMGADFSKVRIHDGAEAADRARAVHAQAFTYGKHIVFNKDRFDPASEKGRHLLAHELTHVVQQNHAPQAAPAAPMLKSDKKALKQGVEEAIDALEKAGDKFTEMVLTNLAIPWDQIISEVLAEISPIAAASATVTRAVAQATDTTAKTAKTAAPAKAKPGLSAKQVSDLLDKWLTVITAQEGVLNTHFKKDKKLKKRLRDAYDGAVGALISAHALVNGVDGVEFYAANSGRIPPWAWAHQHSVKTGYSTPIPEGFRKKGGSYKGEVAGVSVSIAKDKTKDKKVSATGASTRHLLQPDIKYSCAKRGCSGDERYNLRVSYSLKLRTHYGKKAKAADSSAYGRGTSAEDKAGAKSISRSLTLGHHEGEHGLAVMRYLRNNPLPDFSQKGTKAKPISQATVDAEIKQFKADFCKYLQKLHEYSFVSVDCPGTPIGHSEEIEADDELGCAAYTLKCPTKSSPGP